MLTHIPPWHDAAVAEAEARGEWSGRLDLARAGATYESEVTGPDNVTGSL